MKKYIFLGAAMLLLTAACSNDENSNPKEQPKQAVQFSFTNEDFGADETLSRATGTAETKPQIVDLGDCEAEISVENEPAVKTRGTMTNANGHYTIRAYQGGTLKGEMKGTFSGGAFTPDVTSPQDIVLSAGTYDFIAFNDDVIPSGNDLTVDRTKAGTACMGTTTANITATPQKQKVNFTMKHVGCRLRTQFVCKKDIPENITAKLEATAANVIPTTAAYHPATKAYTSTNGAMTAENSNSPASTEARYSASNYGQNYAYTSTSDYHYFLPTTEGSKLKLTGISAGTVFWKPIPTFNIPKLNATLQMQAGKSYLVKIKLKPKFKYLFSDGTTGFRSETTYGGAPAATAKTPIGVVVKDNDGTPSSGIAMALEDANGGNLTAWGPYGYANKIMYIQKGSVKECSGYDLTWDPTTSNDNVTVKGNSTTFPSFYQAGHYAPAVPVTGANVSKWYSPAGMEMYAVLKNFYFSREYYGIIIHGHYCGGYGYLLEQAVTQVGGSLTMNKAIFAATDDLYQANFELYVFFYYGLHFSVGAKQTDRANVRPFVRF